MAVFTAVDDPGSFFTTKLYQGTDSAPAAITGVGFAPDMIWTKDREYDSSHRMHDVRQGPTYSTVPDYGYVSTTSYPFSSFDADGWTINSTNRSLNSPAGEEYASWCWKMGTTTGIDGTGATITPTGYSFNSTAGQSIIQYTGNSSSGALVPHGLGVTPTLIIVKNLTTVESWMIYTELLGATKYLVLDTTAAEATNTGRWNDTAPTSTLFSLGDSASTNENPYSYIAYCFANKQGYFHSGGYTGNVNYDGPTIFCGFRPAYVLIRRYDTTSNWMIYNTKVSTFNLVDTYLIAQNADVEDSTTSLGLDILSTGFKIRGTSNSVNASGGNYWFAAFADQPLANSEGVPSNAR